MTEASIRERDRIIVEGVATLLRDYTKAHCELFHEILLEYHDRQYALIERLLVRMEDLLGGPPPAAPRPPAPRPN
jgi:hypothetical protein